jgi:cytochrome c oxidase subunit 2
MTVLVAGCKGSQSALDPKGPQAGRIAGLWWLTFWVCTAVYVLVLLVVAGALVLKRRKGPPVAKDPTAPVTDPRGGPASDPPVVTLEPAGERRIGMIVGSAVGLTVIILFVLLFADFITGQHVHGFANTKNTVSITLTGHQWWWEVRYDDSTPSDVFTTANEIHIPVGRPVGIQLQSSDVIHSFWVPNLHGKKDLIPGHPAVIYLQADQPGTYYGQCAEYCGYQHANMRLVVVAESQEHFDQWIGNQRQAAQPPEKLTAKQNQGRLVFMGRTCVMCHTIRGTSAGGRMGPDLTHLATRQTLGAGTIPNNVGHLGGWVMDPQRIKPGVYMPQNSLSADELQALLEYLRSLD